MPPKVPPSTINSNIDIRTCGEDDASYYISLPGPFLFLNTYLLLEAFTCALATTTTTYNQENGRDDGMGFTRA